MKYNILIAEDDRDIIELLTLYLGSEFSVQSVTDGAAALELIRASWNERAPIRMLTVTGSGIVPEDEAGEQLSLFEAGKAERRERQEQLESALDKIREKFGRDSLSFGSVLQNDLGIGKYGNQKHE